MLSILYKLAHDKIYSETCVTSKDSDKNIYPPSEAVILVYYPHAFLKRL